jgi:exonuclease SbcD
MAGVKILHAADLHLNGPVSAPDPAVLPIAQKARRQSLQRLVDLARQQQVKLVLLPGDVFDTPNPPVSAALAFSQACKALCNMGVRVFITPGNHDPWQEGSFWQSWTPPEGVTVFTPQPSGVPLNDLGLWVAGAAFNRAHVERDLTALLPKPPAGLTGLACQHCDPAAGNGAQGGPAYAPARLQSMAGMGYSYWALGHQHNPQVLQQNPLIVMAGSPQGAHLGEAGPHGAFVLEVAGGAVSIKFVPLAPLEFYDLSLDDLMETRTLLALADQASAKLQKAGLAQGQAACARLSLGGPSPLWNTMWGETSGELGQELKEALGLTGLVLRTGGLEPPLDTSMLGERPDVLGYLWNLVQRCEDDQAYLIQIAGGLTDLHPAGANNKPEAKLEYLRDLLADVRKLALKDLWLGREE